VCVGYSVQESVAAAVAEIKEKLAGDDSGLVLYFASARYEPASLSTAMQEAFRNSAVIGCSTAGEIVSGKMLKGSLVAMSLGRDVVKDVAVQVVEGIESEGELVQAFAGFEKHFGVSMRDLDHEQYVGIILVDGLSGAEERVIDAIGNTTDIAFVGGSAGDDLQFKKTSVYAEGKAYSNAAVLAVVKPAVPFSVIKTQSFRILDRNLLASEVDEARREVISFNGRPAALAYAEAVGTTVDAAAASFMSHPLGLMVGDEPFVRSPQQMQGDHIRFYCNVLQGMELRLLQSGDIIEDTQKAVQDKQAELGGLSAIINFHCILRTLELEQTGCTDQYGQIFSAVPTVGFSTYGEQYLGHINQTSTMLVFA
jgi:hypothetical protein